MSEPLPATLAQTPARVRTEGLHGYREGYLLGEDVPEVEDITPVVLHIQVVAFQFPIGPALHVGNRPKVQGQGLPKVLDNRCQATRTLKPENPMNTPADEHLRPHFLEPESGADRAIGLGNPVFGAG